MSNQKSLEHIFSLIYQNFDFLHLGLFLDQYMRHYDISKDAKDILIDFSPHQKYRLNRAITKDLASNIFINKNPFFAQLITLNAVRGIMMAMYEGRKEEQFGNYLEEKLTTPKFIHFNCIVSFIRNVLSHNIDDNIRLNEKDFNGTKNNF